jgi:hypothetical protein
MRSGKMSFLEFLEDNGIHDYEDRLSDCCSIEEFNPETWLLEAFPWRHQPEGERFWAELNHRWILKDIDEYGKQFPVANFQEFLYLNKIVDFELRITDEPANWVAEVLNWSDGWVDLTYKWLEFCRNKLIVYGEESPNGS